MLQGGLAQKVFAYSKKQYLVVWHPYEFCTFVILCKDKNYLMSPQAQVLMDNHGRQIDYLRLAVTDRCNLRCFYCMPAEGIAYLPERELLSWEEMLRLVGILHGMGIRKLRLTGGEPLVRVGFLEFVKALAQFPDLELAMTTNGVLLAKHLPELLSYGLKQYNLSLDALDPDRFLEITRRPDHTEVMKALHAMLEAGLSPKINAVVMAGKNEDQLWPLAALAEKHPVSVRFIEEMPFNGAGAIPQPLVWNQEKILAHLRLAYPGLSAQPMSIGATAQTYTTPEFKGDVGIIAAYTRSFCGTCNRLRITAKGSVKTCLYDEGVFDLKTWMREGRSDDEIKSLLLNLNQHRPKDGFEAEARRTQRVSESMTTIGG